MTALRFHSIATYILGNCLSVHDIATSNQYTQSHDRIVQSIISIMLSFAERRNAYRYSKYTAALFVRSTGLQMAYRAYAAFTGAVQNTLNGCPGFYLYRIKKFFKEICRKVLTNVRKYVIINHPKRERELSESSDCSECSLKLNTERYTP